MSKRAQVQHFINILTAEIIAQIIDNCLAGNNVFALYVPCEVLEINYKVFTLGNFSIKKYHNG